MPPLFDSQTLRTVLLVDSDAESRAYLRAEFEARGFAVLEAEDRASTLEVLAHTPVGAVVLDLELSNRQRASLMKEILASRGTPLVFLLVSPSMLSREEAYHLGASGALSKPVDPSYLISRINSLLTPVANRNAKERILPGARHRVSTTVFKHQLGRGGFAFPASAEQSVIEGETVEFQIEVQADLIRPETVPGTTAVETLVENIHEKWTLSGTGVVRYISYDPKRGRHRTWGIEFESLDESSRQRLIQSLGVQVQTPYIPKFAH